MNRKISTTTGLILILFFTGICGCNSSSSGQHAGDNNNDQELIGAGSTFVYPLYSKMFNVYQQKTGVQINYQSIGSGGGILQLKNKTVDFGDSDAPLTDEQTKKMGAPVLHIPVCSGAVTISYNIPGLKDTLKFTPEIIAGIYLGKITKWNAPEIQQANPGIAVPDIPIMVAHRSDGSGTTDIFTGYLSKISPDWAKLVGQGTAVNWPVGLGGKGNEGVAGLIEQTPGAIGYIELAYALQNNMSFGKVENKSGNYITPDLPSTSAAADVQIPPDAKAFVTNTGAANGYPISGFTWALIYKEQDYAGRSLQRAKNLLQLLWWVTHNGQQYTTPLHYAPLPGNVVKVAENLLHSATYDGKPILAQTAQ